MRKQDSAAPTAAATPRNGVLVLTGYGVRVAVERGHLAVSDGRGRERREGRFSRADRELRRLVVLGHTGTISLDALRWLRDVGISFAQIDADGVVVAAFGPTGVEDARLRRAQALAPYNGADVGVARDLLAGKLDGQAAVLDGLGAPEATAFVRSLVPALDGAGDAESLMRSEADAAAAYWSGWSGVGVRWAANDAPKVPDHWRAFRSRLSPLSGGPSRAADPVNALLNYAYAVLEAEAGIACVAVGLDRSMGVLHSDRRGRDSLPLDVIEPARADVDRWLLQQLSARVFRRADFWETRQGVCRLMAPLAKQIAESVTPLAAGTVAPVAERVARLLMDSASSGARVVLPTPLTKSNRRRSGGVPRPLPTPSLPAACRECGAALTRADRTYCADCIPSPATALVPAGLAELARLREEGRDPAHGGEAGRKRGEKNAASQAAVTAWKREHGAKPADPDAFARDILPGLATVPVWAIAQATGLSASYCQRIRRGLVVPHPKNWAVLARLGAEQTP